MERVKGIQATGEWACMCKLTEVMPENKRTSVRLYRPRDLLGSLDGSPLSEISSKTMFSLYFSEAQKAARSTLVSMTSALGSALPRFHQNLFAIILSK